MAEHVVEHVHLFFLFFLAQLYRQFTTLHVGLKDLLLVQEEDHLVAPLSIVGMGVPLLDKVVLQRFYGREESGTVAIIESMVHGVAKGKVFLTS